MVFSTENRKIAHLLEGRSNLWGEPENQHFAACDAQGYIAEYGPDCLTSLERYNLDAKITTKELTTAFKKYSHHSSPVPDGLPFELPIQTGMPSLRFSVIRGIIDGTLPESMKAILLLPVAVRILSYTLNKRFLKVADRMVGSEQKGFLPQRQMQDAIHSVRNFVRYLKQRTPRKAIPFEGLAFVDLGP